MKNKKYKIGICGGFDNSIINGQALRTISITNKIIEIIGENNVLVVKYANWKKRPLKLLFDYIKQIKNCKSLVLCPDERAIKFVIPIASFFSRFFKTRIYYVVIGGWLPFFLKKHRFIKKCVSNIDGLFVQTKILQKELNNINIAKVYILPNFRNHESELLKFSKLSNNGILKTFFLARIEPLKGVEEMIDVIKTINNNSILCTLDIYGSIMPNYKTTFNNLIKSFPPYIHYCGELQSESINRTICEYDLHIFPTKYRTEGFPGSILDAFYAGIPTLSANWNSGKEVINDMNDGLLFEQFNFLDMKNKLIVLCNDRELLNKLKTGSRIRSKQYDGRIIINSMLSIISNNEFK